PPPDGHRIYIVRDDPPPPPPEPDPTDWRETPALLEWSSWLGIGFGVAAEPPTATARSTDPSATTHVHGAVAFDAGIDVTLPPPPRSPAHPPRRGGRGARARGRGAGAEHGAPPPPASIDFFWSRGEGRCPTRAGAGFDHTTAALAWGYRCPWKLWGPYSRSTR